MSETISSPDAAAQRHATRAAAAEHRLYNLSRLVSASIWETDAEFRLTFVSFRAFEYLGMHPQELIGRPLRDIGDFISLDNFKAGGENQSTFRDVFFEVEHRDGEKRLFLVSALPVYDQDTGAFRGMQGTAEEVTKHPRATEGFEALFDAMEQSLILVMIANAEGRIEYANPKFQDATGYFLDELKRMTPRMLVNATPKEYDKKWARIDAGKES
ncbi:MAG: PAS domain-containing protein, partial [Alphaproteobacteria bacterium]